MKVRELIEELVKLDGDLPVIVEADHGQTAMGATWAGEGYVEDITEYMGESLHEDDVTEDSDKVVIIQAY